MRLLILLILTLGASSKADVGRAHKQRIWDRSPNEIRVMVVDTGVDHSHPKLQKYVTYDDDFHKHYVDTHGHGTHVAGIILYGNSHLNDPVCSNVKILSCKYFDPNNANNENLRGMIDCVKWATKLGVDYLNVSGGGLDFSLEEYFAYRDYVQSGGRIIAAAGNEYSKLENTPYYPASYSLESGLKHYKIKGKRLRTIPIYVVQNKDKDGSLSKSSNTHPSAFSEIGTGIFSTLPRNRYGIMSGTSQAAPQLLHTILKQRCIELNSETKISSQVSSN